MSFPASVCSVWAAGRPPGYAFVDFDVKIDAQDVIPLEQRTHRRILCEIMIGNEFRFFLSCDIKLPVTFRIEKLEGHLPSTNFPNPVEIVRYQLCRVTKIAMNFMRIIEIINELYNKQRSGIKELNSYVALRKTYQSTLGNKRVELFDMGAGVSEPMADDNDQVASGLGHSVRNGGQDKSVGGNGMFVYRRFCQATGYGGTVQRRETVEEKIARYVQDGTVTNRKIVVQFNADVSDGMPWKFILTQREVRVKPGESALAFYTAENRSSTPITGMSTYNVTPMKAAVYFNKIQCFCFEEQRLLPGE
ncbi:hypothetical protein L2E82_33098 [Cichorium intybus]|uniref:Uncharacterized protein n=1 Tax=Cichorium intybus TaxID=13427 RepID=A0ACB9BJ93_CICIN|nr:hypothetical protein L2E82_33098 [Cichorium intybus]